MGKKKLFVVTIETEIVVLAETASDAIGIAENIGNHRELEPEDFGYQAATMSHMPSGFDEDCLPFGHLESEDARRTVGQWIEAGAAPEYVAMRDKLKKGSPGA